MHYTTDRDLTAYYLSEMVAIDSINPDLVPGGAGESAMITWLEQTCQALGLQTTRQEPRAGRPNLVARWRGTGGGRSLLFTGHTDVVGVAHMTIPPFQPQVSDGRLYGRGALDMKGGLAAILGAVQALRSGGFAPRGDLILGFVCDEEFFSLGTTALVSEVRADAAILTEPTGAEIVIAHRGFAWLTITTLGRDAHGSLYDVGIDAVAHMGRVLGELERLEREVYPARLHPLLGRASAHAGEISGGIGPSTYPNRCTLGIEHRLLPDESAADVVTLWQAALDRFHAQDPDFNAVLDLGFERPGYEIDPDAPIVRELQAAWHAVTGRAPSPCTGMRAWLDSAILAAAGIPTVIFGPGGDGMHAAVEYVDLESVFLCAAVIAEAAARWCG